MPKLLLPLDASPTSAITLAGGRGIMGAHPWTIRIINAGGDPDGSQRAALEHVAADLRGYGHTATVDLLRAAADGAAAIERATGAMHIDLVIVTRPDRVEPGAAPALQPWLHDDLALRTAQRKLRCPLLIMTPEQAPRPGRPPYAVRHALVALDGSATAEIGIEVSLVIADQLGARVSVVSAISDSTSPEAADRRAYLEGVTERFHDRIRLGTIVAAGASPPDAIADAAARAHADLIVLTTHGAQGTRLTGLGGVAAAVVQTSRVPVFLVRPTSTQTQFGVGAYFHKV